VTVKDVEDEDEILERYGDARIRELYVRKMFSADVIEELGTTYGDRLFSYDGHDQIAAAVQKLEDDWWTNKATLTLLDPLERWPERRMPCLTVVDLKIRDSQLLLYAFFRSQNVLNSYGNMYGLRAIQSYCADKLGVAVGPMTLFVTSPHVHERDMERARQIVDKC
jgi:thymidylate synthase